MDFLFLHWKIIMRPSLNIDISDVTKNIDISEWWGSISGGDSSIMDAHQPKPDDALLTKFKGQVTYR